MISAKKLSFVLILSMISMLFSSTALAGRVKLAKLTRSDEKSEVSYIYLYTRSNGTIRYLRIISYCGRRDCTLNTGEKLIVYPSQLKRGKTLFSKKNPLTGRGISIIKLYGRKISTTTGGKITLRYLRQYRLIGKNSYGYKSMTLKRVGSSWALYSGLRRIRRLHARIKGNGINSIR